MWLRTPRTGDQLAQWIELGAIVGEPADCLGRACQHRCRLDRRLLDLKYAALTAQAGQTEAVRAVVGEKRYREIIRIERFAVIARQAAPVVLAVR